MYIQNDILDLMISKLTIEYSGTHNSDLKNPLWGRRAYWRIFMQDYGFVCKITAPVKSINPTQKTLNKLFRAELKKRLNAIDTIVQTDHYSQIHVIEIDPYSVRTLLKCVQGKYLNLEKKTA